MSNASFNITDVTGCYHYDNIRCHRCRQNLHHDSSVTVIWWRGDLGLLLYQVNGTLCVTFLWNFITVGMRPDISLSSTCIHKMVQRLVRRYCQSSKAWRCIFVASYIFPALEFDRHLDSSAAGKPVKLQADRKLRDLETPRGLMIRLISGWLEVKRHCLNFSSPFRLSHTMCEVLYQWSAFSTKYPIHQTIRSSIVKYILKRVCALKVMGDTPCGHRKGPWQTLSPQVLKMLFFF